MLTDVGDSRWGPPLVGGDCQANFQGFEGSEWETMNYNYEELHKAVKCSKSGEQKGAKAIWSWKAANVEGINCHVLVSVQQIQTRSQVRLALWASPTAAWADVLKLTEDGAGRAQSSAALNIKSHFEFSILFDVMTMDLSLVSDVANPTRCFWSKEQNRQP